MKEIARGAEAILYEDGDTVVKYREKKGYRIDKIDSPLRKSRTKREFSILKRCVYAGISVPKPIKISKEGDKLFMVSSPVFYIFKMSIYLFKFFSNTLLVR